MGIELHELVVSLKPEIFIVVNKGTEELIRDNVANIEDLQGYHHNHIVNIRRILGSLVIDIE